MGTNFYHVTETKPACECCKRPYEKERLHIGKSSAGWVFALHVIPEDGINTLEDWIARWATPGTFIENEYGDRLPPDEMLSWIVDRARKPKNTLTPHDYARNGAVPGPNQLMRSAIGQGCIGHGPGTYDYIQGEFS